MCPGLHRQRRYRRIEHIRPRAQTAGPNHPSDGRVDQRRGHHRLRTDRAVSQEFHVRRVAPHRFDRADELPAANESNRPAHVERVSQFDAGQLAGPQDVQAEIRGPLLPRTVRRDRSRLPGVVDHDPHHRRRPLGRQVEHSRRPQPGLGFERDFFPCPFTGRLEVELRPRGQASIHRDVPLGGRLFGCPGQGFERQLAHRPLVARRRVQHQQLAVFRIDHLDRRLGHRRAVALVFHVPVKKPDHRLAHRLVVAVRSLEDPDIRIFLPAEQRPGRLQFLIGQVHGLGREFVVILRTHQVDRLRGLDGQHVRSIADLECSGDVVAEAAIVESQLQAGHVDHGHRRRVAIVRRERVKGRQPAA